jgi:hypothetical protein
MTAKRAEFGFWPNAVNLSAGQVCIDTLPNINVTVESVMGVEDGWVYAPPQQVTTFGGGVRTRPYPARVFGLPKTHCITLANSDGPDHIAFHLWVLSFFVGLRLTTTEAGFLDATSVRPGTLNDFVLLGNSLETAIEMAERFWVSNRHDPQRAKLFGASVHALFLAQNPRHLQFEEFVLLYTALDACYALAKLLNPSQCHPHVKRVQWMCGLFNMPTPTWADTGAANGPAVAALRNATLHEALFVEQPLGFAVHGVGSNQNITLEMRALLCRFLVALIGGDKSDYVRTPTNTRQQHGLALL